MTHEPQVSVRYYTCGDAMQTHDFLDEKIRDVSCIVCLVAWYEMGRLRKLVHKNKNIIFATLETRKSQDKVNGNISPG
ncbi:hypothetical protein Fmac_001334 [Flemingia macrophylla]|uniref:Uncharacterized protein n=1 Tax=Flemingia macrophylla TaxID=520843 RepID=A0ABD1NGU3_9FABA